MNERESRRRSGGIDDDQQSLLGRAEGQFRQKDGGDYTCGGERSRREKFSALATSIRRSWPIKMPDWRISILKPSRAHAGAGCGELLSTEEMPSERIVRRTVRGILECPRRCWRRTPEGKAMTKETNESAKTKASVTDLQKVPDLNAVVDMARCGNATLWVNRAIVPLRVSHALCHCAVPIVMPEKRVG